MTKNIVIDPFSAVPLYLKVMRKQTQLSIATGFAYKHAAELFLVTCWHVLSGRYPESGQPIDQTTGAVPDHLRVVFPIKEKLGHWLPGDIPVVSEDNAPLWFQHPIHGQRIDVAVLPFTCLPDLTVYPLNDCPMTDDMAFAVGHDVFILGFPLGLRAGGAFPVWKRGSVASEPDLDLEGLPVIMVDTATYSGMSGSPVVARQWNQYQSRNGNLAISPGNTFTRIVGVYSGRKVGAQGDASQLGQVWKGSVIDDILTARCRGAYEIR